MEAEYTVEVVQYSAVALVGYFVGSFPTGYLVARGLKGVDPRQHGSGRTGGTNVLRSAGRGAALLTILGDLLKGILAVLVARWVAGTYVAAVVAGLAALLGHNRSIFLGFHGGAGSMTNAGVMLALAPHVVPFMLMGALVAALLSHTAAVVSITAATVMVIGLVLSFLLALTPTVYVLYGVLALALILFELRPNIARLRAGSERRVDNY